MRMATPAPQHERKRAHDEGAKRFDPRAHKLFGHHRNMPRMSDRQCTRENWPTNQATGA